ncbi:hypothetical protein FB381_4120 [Nocardioides albertanoniae]|uniref:Uncharacterized protein n=1 Tax=Nocardioides albertanoniae TaxID=1175486 RepID=A0A543AC70_9ACTN|nr:hypothetical protein [Nocardioides albertanoniae]TQL70191.1 hypothetical protein FB381_4120 [Nocardioides albertanoniae]
MTDNEEPFVASEAKRRANANWPQTNWASPLLKGAWVRIRNEGSVRDGRVLGSRKLEGEDAMIPVAIISGAGLHALRAAEGIRRLSDPDDSTKEYVPMILWPIDDNEEIPPPGRGAAEWWVRAAWKREHL